MNKFVDAQQAQSHPTTTSTYTREATNLYDQWPTLPGEDKRKIVEALVEKVQIGNGKIDITLSYLPTSEQLCKTQQGLGTG